MFRAMFYSCPMKEAMENKVIMEDMPREALVAFVEFMYTATVTPAVMRCRDALLCCSQIQSRVSEDLVREGISDSGGSS